MKSLSIPITLSAFVLHLVQFHAVEAQPVTPPASQSQDPEAPEWLAWRAFHESLKFYEGRSSDTVTDLLRERTGLEGSQKFAFMNAGSAYVRRLDAIDEEVRAGVFASYKDQLTPKSNVDIRELIRPEAGLPTRNLLPGTTRDGRNVKSLLEADGIVTQLEARRAAALQSHLDTLRRSFGDEALSRMERWVSAEVAPNVHIDDKEYQVPPRSFRPYLNNEVIAR